MPVAMSYYKQKCLFLRIGLMTSTMIWLTLSGNKIGIINSLDLHHMFDNIAQNKVDKYIYEIE